MADELKQLETVASELIGAFGIISPPVPVETMLRQPRPGMWEQIDVNQLSGSFLSIKDVYSPRMSMARLLARHIVGSPWGTERGLTHLIKDEENLRAFARMLVMPKEMVTALSGAARTPTAMSLHFEVPEDDARQRLLELTTLL